MTIITSDKAAQDDRVLTYMLTRSPLVQKLSTLSGQRIDVIHYCIYEDEKPNKPGEVSTIIAFMTREGELFASNSATIRGEFLNILEIFGEDLDKEDGYIPIKIIEGVSKNNRTFFTCTYVD